MVMINNDPLSQFIQNLIDGNENEEVKKAALNRNFLSVEDKTKNKSTADTFTVAFYDNETKKNVAFNFALLPAIETSAAKGQGGVPEVKPGVVTMTNVKYKNFLIPGATPILQAIGVQSTVHQFVGAFIGSETISDNSARPSLNHIYRLNGDAVPWTDTENAIAKARMFDHKVVQGARPITLTLNADAVYIYEGVVVSFKFYAVRADRAYYTMDLLASVYPSQLPAAPSRKFLSDGAYRGQSPETDKPAPTSNVIYRSDGANRGRSVNADLPNTSVFAPPVPPGTPNRGPDFRPPDPAGARTSIQENPNTTINKKF